MTWTIRQNRAPRSRKLPILKTLAAANYRSINKWVIPLGRLNLITGPNGSGRSNLYRALRLLAETAQGGVVNALARVGPRWRG